MYLANSNGRIEQPKTYIKKSAYQSDCVVSVHAQLGMWINNQWFLNWTESSFLMWKAWKFPVFLWKQLEHLFSKLRRRHPAIWARLRSSGPEERRPVLHRRSEAVRVLRNMGLSERSQRLQIGAMQTSKSSF